MGRNGPAPEPGDLLVSRATATREFLVTIVPTSQCVLRGVANSAVTAGLDFAQQLASIYGSPRITFTSFAWPRFGRNDIGRLTPPLIESVGTVDNPRATTRGHNMDQHRWLPAWTYGRRDRRGVVPRPFGGSIALVYSARHEYEARPSFRDTEGPALFLAQNRHFSQ
jgi:hypothetical protein